MIEIIDNIEQGDEEWHTLRLGSVGSSSVKNAMAGGAGKTRLTLMYNLIAESITGEKTTFKTTAAIEEGNRREPESRSYFELVSGINFEQVAMVKNPNFPGQHSSPDGINRDLECGLELKNPQANTMVRYLDKGTLPSVYKAQCQHALMITGWDLWYFVAYHPAFENQLILEVKRDEKYISTMRSKLDSFLREMEAMRVSISKKSQPSFNVNQKPESKLEIDF